MTAAGAAVTRPSVVQGATVVAHQVLVGAAAGALVGFVVGGGLGRLVMFVLRMTSPAFVSGLETDDGFTIGRFDAVDTLNLMFGVAAVGAANGALYAVARRALAPRARIASWTLFTGLVGASFVVQPGGLDFTLLAPLELAIVFFVALPFLCGLAVAVAVERLQHVEWTRLRTAGLGAAALVGTIGLVVAAAAGLVALAAARIDPRGRAARAGRLLLPVVMLAASLAAAARLIDVIVEIL